MHALQGGQSGFLFAKIVRRIIVDVFNRPVASTEGGGAMGRIDPRRITVQTALRSLIVFDNAFNSEDDAQKFQVLCYLIHEVGNFRAMRESQEVFWSLSDDRHRGIIVKKLVPELPLANFFDISEHGRFKRHLKILLRGFRRRRKAPRKKGTVVSMPLPVAK